MGLLVALLAIEACSGGAPASAGCPANAGATCPSSPPSWKADVQPIVESRCGPCHLAGGVETKVPHPLDYSTYDGVHANYSTMDLVVSNCLMPPGDAGALTAEQSQTLLEWFACGAPDN